MKFKRNKTISLLLSFCLVFGIFAITPKQDVVAASLSDLQKQEQKLQSEQKKIETNLKKAKAEKANQQIIQAQIDAQIDNTEAQIHVLKTRISTLNSEIEAKNIEIQNTQAEIDRNTDLFKKRLRASYMSGGNSSTLTLLLGADSFSELLTRAEIVKRVAEQDKSLIEGLKANKQKIEEARAAIAANKAQVENDKNSESNKKKQLDASFSKSTASINALKELETTYARDFDKIQKSIQELDKKITAMLLANQGGGTLSPGGWMWPVQGTGYKDISSPFGNRTLYGKSEFHLGIDIRTGGQGKSVVASKSGKVITSTSHYSYGNYIIIDHGGGYATLYAHNSSIKVSVGQIVSQGQVIAITGSTGHSYGVHLHFEVRVNGVAKNPMSYL